MARSKSRLDALFRRVVASNRRAAQPLPLADGFESAARAYASTDPADGRILLQALDRNPRFHQGGWILRLQPKARAMTLDTDIFVARGRSLGIRTYVHELVHVDQYGRLGAVEFLEQYFGSSIRGIARRLVRRQRLDPMTASPLERDAYDLAGRFMTWHQSR